MFLAQFEALVTPVLATDWLTPFQYEYMVKAILVVPTFELSSRMPKGVRSRALGKSWSETMRPSTLM